MFNFIIAKSVQNDACCKMTKDKHDIAIQLVAYVYVMCMQAACTALRRKMQEKQAMYYSKK